MMLLFPVLLLAHCYGQGSVTPPAAAFDRKYLRTGYSEMGYYNVTGGGKKELCHFGMEVRSTDKTISVYTWIYFLQSDLRWTDTSIADAKTLQPVYKASHHGDINYMFRFGKELTGYYRDKKTGVNKTISEPVSSSFFDSNMYPYLLGLLPLTSGYQASLPVFDYKPSSASHIKPARITSVKSSIYRSAITGEYKTWLVTVLEDATGDQYDYYIDKSTRRIWQIDIRTKDQQLMLADREIDFQPIKARFDKEATLKMITEGSGVISGEAFARDNKNGGALRGMAVLNMNKKQYAAPGTAIVLVPYTEYFREWEKLNASQKKKGYAQFTLPDEVKACMKVATVYDSKGNFEFVNLQPGKYLLYTSFGFVHTGSRTEIVGYTDSYINGNYTGSTANTHSYDVFSDAQANVDKVVTISKEGEKVSVKLKQTL